MLRLGRQMPRDVRRRVPVQPHAAVADLGTNAADGDAKVVPFKTRGRLECRIRLKKSIRRGAA